MRVVTRGYPAINVYPHHMEHKETVKSEEDIDEYLSDLKDKLLFALYELEEEED